MSKNSFLVMMSHKKLLLLFLTGKLIRFIFFIFFIYFLIGGTGTLAGFTVEQTIFFYLTFNVIDVFSQFLFREVYRFRPLLISGDFDLILVKPTSALFRVLMGGADVIDLITIPPLLLAVWYVGSQLGPTAPQVILYIILIINGLLISTAFHIAVLSMGILTFEVDHTVMIYRDTLNLGRFPVDIYRQPLRAVLTFIIPIGIMITLSAKGLMGLATPEGVAISFLVAFVSMFLAFRFWNHALKHYTSASS